MRDVLREPFLDGPLEPLMELFLEPALLDFFDRFLREPCKLLDCFLNSCFLLVGDAAREELAETTGDVFFSTPLGLLPSGNGMVWLLDILLIL